MARTMHARLLPLAIMLSIVLAVVHEEERVMNVVSAGLFTCCWAWNDYMDRHPPLYRRLDSPRRRGQSGGS